MVIWRNVIKRIFTASLPTIIFPVTIIILIIKHFGFTIDSLLATIFFGQFYIIWAQLEVALRQTRLFVLRYEPELKMKVETTIASLGAQTFACCHAKLKNVGKYLARNVSVTGNVKPTSTESYPPKYIGDIAPGEEVEAYHFEEKVFNASRIIITVAYENILGEFSGIVFVKEPEFREFLVTRSIGMPGILLNSFEDLVSTLRALTLSRRVKKLR